jgi:predicted CoA-binding protein
MSPEETILKNYHNVAMVGVSSNEEHPSFRVFSYLTLQGYNVIPVNPNEQEVMGKTSYPDLLSIPGEVEVVDIFRKPDQVMPIIGQAIEIGVKAVWMQEGIVNEEAAARAKDAGLLVVMGKCMRKQLINLSGQNHAVKIGKKT